MSNDMTQQINLYLPEFRPRNDWMTAGRLLVIVLATCLLVAMLSGIDYWRRYALQQELAQLQNQANSQQAVTEQIERSLASRATDQALLNEVSARQATLDQLNGTLEILRTSSQGNLNGFSGHLKNLSSASFEGLWLTDIRISEGGERATLQGYALESAMAASFVDRLSRGWQNADGWRFTRITGSTSEAWLADEPADNEVAGAEAATPQADPLPGTYRFKLETQ